MDPTRDNPIIRFNTFWWALWTFLIFAILLAALMIYERKPPASLEGALAEARYATKEKIIKAQAASLTRAEIEAAIPRVAAQLASLKPAAVERPEQVVPGSPTAQRMAAEPASPAAPTRKEGGQNAPSTVPVPPAAAGVPPQS